LAISGAANQFLMVGSGTHTCALPLEHVIETVRPLAIEPVSQLGESQLYESRKRRHFVLGLTILRGAPVPVVDLYTLLSGNDVSPRREARPAARFVSLRIQDRAILLAVDRVLGVRALSKDHFRDLPPLLSNADIVESIGMLDEALLVVLRAARLHPDDWERSTPEVNP